MIITLFLIAIGVRMMVDMRLIAFLDSLHYNHIVIPPLGWRLEVAKILITVVIISPIFATIATYS